MTPPMILIAASGLAREVMEAVAASGSHEVVGLLDDNAAYHGCEVRGVPVIGGLHLAVNHPAKSFVVCAGAGKVRAELISRLREMGVPRESFCKVIHPGSIIGSSCSVGLGSIVLANVTMTADVSVGAHVVVMPNVVLTHDDVVSDFATICAGVAMGGGVTIGRAAYLGMNSAVRENLIVGAGAVLGMGSVLLQNLPDEQTWGGVPAIPIGASRRASTAAMVVGGVA